MEYDGDVDMDASPIPQPIYEFVRPPQLASWEHGALVTWLHGWNHYVTKIRHRCSVTGERYESVVATVKGTVRPDVLDVIARYVLKKPLEHISDEEVLLAVQARTQTLVNAFVPDVKTLFRQMLRMDLSVDDCDARVFRYYQDFERIVEENGLHGLIGRMDPSHPDARDCMKARCRLLIENLHPAVLREQVERLVDLERRDCKTDDVALYDLICEHARAQQRYHRLSRELGGGSAGGRTTRTQQPRQSAQRRGNDNTGSKNPNKKAGPGPGKPAVKEQKLPPNGCLACHGAHWLKDCPTASEQQRQEALSKYYADKEQRANAVRSKALMGVTTLNSVRINDLLEVPYLPDTGAERSVLPRAVVQTSKSLQPSLDVSRLEQPVRVQVADGRELLCEQEVHLDLALTTAAGPVNMRQVPCLIIESSEHELLLGKDALGSLGIDIDKMLAQLATGTALAEDEDEYPVGESTAEVSIETRCDIAQAEALVERAREDGLDAAQVEELRGLVSRFPEVWADGAGYGPPANVEPLRIKLKDNATPVRCRQRKYAPLQSSFLRQHVAVLLDKGLVRKNNAARWAAGPTCSGSSSKARNHRRLQAHH